MAKRKALPWTAPRTPAGCCRHRLALVKRCQGKRISLFTFTICASLFCMYLINSPLLCFYCCHGFSFQMLEQQIIRFRENQMEGTTGAVKSLEMHHLEYTDLKGRVVRYNVQNRNSFWTKPEGPRQVWVDIFVFRCDSSLAKLALELREFHETIRQIDQRALSVEIQLQEKVHSLERRVREVNFHWKHLSSSLAQHSEKKFCLFQMGTLGSEIDKSTTEHTLQIKHAEGDYSTNLQSLESKMRYSECKETFSIEFGFHFRSQLGHMCAISLQIADRRDPCNHEQEQVDRNNRTGENGKQTDQHNE